MAAGGEEYPVRLLGDPKLRKVGKNVAQAHAGASHFSTRDTPGKTKAYIPLRCKIPAVGGWRRAMPPTPEFCVGDTNMLVYFGVT